MSEMMGFWDAVASAGSYANNMHLAPDRLPCTPTPHHSIFYRPDALPDAKPASFLLLKIFISPE